MCFLICVNNNSKKTIDDDIREENAKDDGDNEMTRKTSIRPLECQWFNIYFYTYFYYYLIFIINFTLQ